MHKTTRSELHSRVMLPNGKPPIDDWKPSDGYTEPKGSRIFQRCLAVLVLLVLAGLLTVVSMP